MQKGEERAAYLNGLMRWRLGVQDQADRVRASRGAFLDTASNIPAGLAPEGSPLEANWTLVEQWRLRNAVHFLLVAVRNVIRFTQAVHGALGDAEIAVVLRQFQEAEPHADLLRNIHEHVDEYIAGRGWQSSRFPDSPREGSIEVLPEDVRYQIGGIDFSIENLIEHSLDLSAAAIHAAQRVLYGPQAPSTT